MPWGMVLSRTPIHLVYHIALGNNWAEIVRDQLAAIESSGLGEVFESMTVTTVGKKTEELDLLFDAFRYRKKTAVIHASNDFAAYEFPAIEKVREIARINSGRSKILYFHTKGVSCYNTPLRENVRLWRKYMEHFVIAKWEDCLQALDEFDACGVDLSLSERAFYFSGNFWWGRGDYLYTCDLKYIDRADAEAFIGRGCCPKLKTFHQSGNNPKLDEPQYAHLTRCYPNLKTDRCFTNILDLYRFPYLPEYYEEVPS